jgi:hypothetical protein
VQGVPDAAAGAVGAEAAAAAAADPLAAYSLDGESPLMLSMLVIFNNMLCIHVLQGRFCRTFNTAGMGSAS